MQEVAKGLAGQLARVMEEERRAFHQVTEAAGGPARWFQTECPTFAGKLEKKYRVSLSDAALFANTQAFWEDGEIRVRSCSGCTMQRPGQCRDQRLCIERGEQPFWDGARVSVEGCQEWGEYRMQSSMRRSGVEPRMWASCFAAIERDGMHKHITALQQLAAAWLKGDDGWAVLVGHDPFAQQELAVSTLRYAKELCRSLQQREPPLHYLDLSRASADLLAHTRREATDGPDPLDAAHSAHLLVLDSVYPGDQRAWLKTAIDRLLYSRWQRRRPTVVCSDRHKGALAKEYRSAARALEGATEITVTAPPPMLRPGDSLDIPPARPPRVR